MTNQEQTNNIQDRKNRIMLTGIGIGAVFGLISSYLYARAAQENDNPDAGKPESISTGQLLTLLLAILGVVRQVSEMGKPAKSDKSDKSDKK
jgi:uncharacterized membrane protein